MTNQFNSPALLRRNVDRFTHKTRFIARASGIGTALQDLLGDRTVAVGGGATVMQAPEGMLAVIDKIVINAIGRTSATADFVQFRITNDTTNTDFAVMIPNIVGLSNVVNRTIEFNGKLILGVPFNPSSYQGGSGVAAAKQYRLQVAKSNAGDTVGVTVYGYWITVQEAMSLGIWNNYFIGAAICNAGTTPTTLVAAVAGKSARVEMVMFGGQGDLTARNLRISHFNTGLGTEMTMFRFFATSNNLLQAPRDIVIDECDVSTPVGSGIRFTESNAVLNNQCSILLIGRYVDSPETWVPSGFPQVDPQDVGNVTSAAAGSLTDLGKAQTWINGSTMTGMFVTITGGTGAGQTRLINTNSATVLTIATNWDVVPDTTSTYAITGAAGQKWWFCVDQPGAATMSPLFGASGVVAQGQATSTGSTIQILDTNAKFSALGPQFGQNYQVEIYAGTNQGQVRTLQAGGADATTLVVTVAWGAAPDSTSKYRVKANGRDETIVVDGMCISGSAGAGAEFSVFGMFDGLASAGYITNTIVSVAAAEMQAVQTRMHVPVLRNANTLTSYVPSATKTSLGIGFVNGQTTTTLAGTIWGRRVPNTRHVPTSISGQSTDPGVALGLLRPTWQPSTPAAN